LKVLLIDSDDLPQWFEQVPAGPWPFPLASGAQQTHAQLGQVGLELATVVVLVGNEGLVVPADQQGRVGGQDAEEGFAFVGFGAGQREADREAVGGCRPGAAAGPRSSANGWRSSRRRPSRPDRGV
jgi:hypothetical protein